MDWTNRKFNVKIKARRNELVSNEIKGQELGHVVDHKIKQFEACWPDKKWVLTVTPCE